MTRQLLVVCSANVCRSPVVERLLTRALANTIDIDGETWRVSSAGTGSYSAELDRNTVAAAADIGIDISKHEPRMLDRDILNADGADLVLTLARAHLPAVVGIDPSSWPRTFTLKELARRANHFDPPSSDEGFSGWRRRMSEGRVAAAMLNPDEADDAADPYGLAKRHHVQMVNEVLREVQRLITWGPWRADDVPTPPQ